MASLETSSPGLSIRMRSKSIDREPNSIGTAAPSPLSRNRTPPRRSKRKPAKNSASAVAFPSIGVSDQAGTSPHWRQHTTPTRKDKFCLQCELREQKRHHV